MTRDERIAKAKSELETDFKERLEQVLGQNFTAHPAYDTIVEEVAGGRYPICAISDRMGR